MKLKKGDKVIIKAGKDKGKKGKIEKIILKKQKEVLPGLNIYKRHLKKKDEKQQGGIIEFSRPLPIGSISLICNKCGKPTRIGFLKKGKEKKRICKKCKSVI